MFGQIRADLSACQQAARSGTRTLIDAMRVLAADIQSEDGVANAAIAEAADRLEEYLVVNQSLVACMNGGTKVSPKWKSKRAKSNNHALEEIIVEMAKSNKIIDVTEVAMTLFGDAFPVRAQVKRQKAYKIVASHLLEHMEKAGRLVQHGAWQDKLNLEEGGPYFTLPEANTGA